MSENRDSKVISVGSIKHGQGITCFTFNLAYKLSTLLDKKILIIDTNFMFKEIAYIAEQTNPNGIDDLISMVKTQELSQEIFMLYTEEVNKHLRVINSTQIDTLDYIRKNDKYIIKIIEEAKKYFDIIIIDAGAGVNKNSLIKQIYEVSDVFINMLTQNAYIIDWYVNHSEFKDEKVINVINMYEEDVYPDYGDITKEFKLSDLSLVRYSKLFKNFYNQKILDPFYKTDDLFNNDFSQLIIKVAEKLNIKELKKLDIVNTNMLIDSKYNEKAKKGFFARLFSSKK